MIKIISEWLNISKSKVRILTGHTTRHKTLEIDVNPEIFNDLVTNVPRLPRQSTLF
jgi:uncharacterized protein YggU (UPF0235/DUF167 family)